MKFWEKFQSEQITKQLESNETKPWWWWVFAAIGFVIGLSISGLFGLLLLIPLGFFASLLWNYAVTPIFNVAELTTYTAVALLFLIWLVVRVFKWASN